MGLRLHDYFIARAIELLKPGGLAAFVTSTGTMDKADARGARAHRQDGRPYRRDPPAGGQLPRRAPAPMSWSTSCSSASARSAIRKTTCLGSTSMRCGRRRRTRARYASTDGSRGTLTSCSERTRSHRVRSARPTPAIRVRARSSTTLAARIGLLPEAVYDGEPEAIDINLDDDGDVRRRRCRKTRHGARAAISSTRRTA